MNGKRFSGTSIGHKKCSFDQQSYRRYSSFEGTSFFCVICLYVVFMPLWRTGLLSCKHLSFVEFNMLWLFLLRCSLPKPIGWRLVKLPEKRQNWKILTSINGCVWMWDKSHIKLIWHFNEQKQTASLSFSHDPRTHNAKCAKERPVTIERNNWKIFVSPLSIDRNAKSVYCSVQSDNSSFHFRSIIRKNWHVNMASFRLSKNKRHFVMTKECNGFYSFHLSNFHSFKRKLDGDLGERIIVFNIFKIIEIYYNCYTFSFNQQNCVFFLFNLQKCL